MRVSIKAGMLAAILSWLVLRGPLAGSGLLALASMTVGALLLASDRQADMRMRMSP
jgi:hypothetical protein